jgi:predicted ArsR family transcriptional regulator
MEGAGAFNLWMECRTQQEIAEAVGYSEKAVREFLDLLRNGENGTDTENPILSENTGLTSEADREFDEDETEDSNTEGYGRRRGKPTKTYSTAKRVPSGAAENC